MASIPAIRDGIQARIETIDGLRGSDIVPDQFNPPIGIVMPDDPTVVYEQSMGGLALFRFRIRVYAGAVSERAAQDLLDGFLSTSGAASMYEAIDGDQTLGGTVETSHITEASVVTLRIGDGASAASTTRRYLGADFKLEAFA